MYVAVRLSHSLRGIFPIECAKSAFASSCRSLVRLCLLARIHSETCFDSIAQVNCRRRENLCKFFGHIGVLDGLRERGKHLASEFTRRVDRATAGWLVERVARGVVQVGSPSVIAARLDSHGVANFCTSVPERCSARVTHGPFTGVNFLFLSRWSRFRTKPPSYMRNFAHRNRKVRRFDVQNSDGDILDAKPRGVI